jgi:hypothetical protein
MHVTDRMSGGLSKQPRVSLGSVSSMIDAIGESVIDPARLGTRGPTRLLSSAHPCVRARLSPTASHWAWRECQFAAGAVAHLCSANPPPPVWSLHPVSECVQRAGWTQPAPCSISTPLALAIACAAARCADSEIRA